MSGNPNLAIAEAIIWLAFAFYIPLMLGAPL